MRLGQTDEAWKLAEEIRASDSYNTQAHNLGLLEREMSGYHVEKADDFIIRLPLRDWQVYGPRALTLLREARSVLAPKYGHTFTKPTLVEFFPSQQDFAIRTFGALGGQGLLGVCFGTVITMNSPGSLAHARSNWESTLWHEFCHVVTLSVTHNRMPRWLSEGISVYEERQRDTAWGMRMNEDFRRIILEDGGLTPMGQLSGAFMNAKNEEGIMFAYYESSMAVEWLIAQHGWESFRSVLRDLAAGSRINAALEKNIGPLDKLEPAFSDYMIAQAKSFAPGADWAKPEPPLGENAQDVLAFLKKKQGNLAALQQLADIYLSAKDWAQAAEVGQKLIDLNPDDVSGDSGWWVRAKAMHQMKNLPEETRLLRAMAAKTGDALPVFLRLIEIDVETQKWEEAENDARRAFALNPFLAQPNETLASASAAQGRPDVAIESLERLLRLTPANPARVRFQLAALLRPKDPANAKRHLLDALVLAPRYKEAQKLLLEMQP
jgi:tetratricopeptide (TPR) repeat protein